METSNKKYLVIILLLAIASLTLGMRLIKLQNQYDDIKNQVSQNQLNGKTLVFMQTFIEKVLKAKTEVSFEERLSLENMVRELNDKEILDRWNSFVKSQTEQEAQDNVKELLDLLANKIKT